ncbi:NAD(P)/FAD-dependent oxidoreductase [Staphylococcus gallinarum]|jgi:nitrite reductase (NADH) large subunit|uniref:NAD(P)/FAD-dependent oxidoreductase n=1 Tax=Staphylococcus gallinarum TaxID=1293 RepID=A0A2T4T0S7_STAGA|nr:nitrite reductase large subunit NirB [Staphylococcus gallinarum]MCD8821409.1 nitrite reductase large subunit NirB [Staphylococcus gallinarum]MCD8826928.1 nitrite reductase large subunit NirB [Staphylococcus gallinarum]PTE79564.1 nitrite reductase large subunit [Staphylococcus gallinarum]PTL11757.1 nitrite reductase large subunit [Staphylococcus gallinarum]RIL33574.1 NAD(P)/FAD-dependent oxidoreductase [Staphylococcus gallinarum]
MTKERLVMIGNGMAGIRTIEEILERDDQKFEITIIGKEPYPNYNRIMLSNILQKKMTQTDIIMNDFDWYESHDIHLVIDDPVTEVDKLQKQVMTQSGLTFEYDICIFATGSKAFTLPIPGSTFPSVIGWRTLEDTEKMIEIAKTKKHAIVIGGGLLGLECARGLLDQGMEVTVIHLADWLMEMQLDKKAGMLLQNDLIAQGMKFKLNASTEEIIGDTDVTGIRLADGTKLLADLVVMAVGIRPYNEVARQCGLEVNRGIVVNDYLQTSDDSIYAIGECAEHNGLVYGLVAPLYEQGQVLADYLTDRETTGYHGSTTFTSLKVSGCDLYSAGYIKEDDITKGIEMFDSVNMYYKKVFLREGKLVGAVLYGDVADGPRFFNMMKQDQSLDDYTLVSMLHKGTETESNNVAALSDDSTICGCNGVSKGKIVTAIKEEGLTSVDEVTKLTKAGNSCGKCKSQINELLQHTLGDDFVAAKPAGICACTDLTRDQIVTQIRAKGLKTSKEVRHVLQFKDKGGCPKCRPAINYYLNMVYPHDHEDETASRFANERYHANIQNDGTFSVIPQMRGGVTDADQLIQLGTVAKKYQIPLVKVTGSQRIGLYGVKKELLPQIWDDLGMRSASAYGKKTRSVKSCVGKSFCRFGTQDTTKLAIRLESTFEYIDTPHKFKMGVSGCPRSCVESGVKDFGVIGVENGFQIYIGGNGGTEVTVGQYLTTVETEDEVVKLCGALMQYYRETGIYAERTAPWLNRLGFDRVKDVILNETQQTQLFQRIMEAKEVVQAEPWQQISSQEKESARFAVEEV